MTEHPAKFSAEILDVLTDLVSGSRLILDPFAGTGRVHELGVPSVGVEIQPRWAELHRQTIVGNALHLPFCDSAFDGIVTSPTYGNRMADHHNASERCKACKGTGFFPPGGWVPCSKCSGAGRRPYKRFTYRHVYGEPLHPDNSGQLQWGPSYRIFHEHAWREAVRVLQPGGRFLLNCSDHIRNGEVQPVSTWHVSCLCRLGLEVVTSYMIETRRQRRGANRDLRVNHEWIFHLHKPTEPGARDGTGSVLLFPLDRSTMGGLSALEDHATGPSREVQDRRLWPV